ncbi:MAG: hypothetical protein KA175_04640 [Flavobacteriales bacterium]|nr:hypothetical protein [Flavobacteriales bacterium]MBP6696882.1 hypothetical protein [Flavobacteriales bacterium]
MSFRPFLPGWLLALSILGCPAPKALAQDKPVKQKPQVILYKDMVSAQWDTVKCVKNAIKINPLLFFRGEIPIHYERALTPRLSVELGLGFTWRDYLNLNFGGGDADDYGGGTDIIARPTYHVGLRWYHQVDFEPQGWYNQLEFAHVEYVKNIKEVEPDGSIGTTKHTDKKIYNDIRLLAGYQLLSASSNWLFDIYGGVGMRSRDLNLVKETLDLTSDPIDYIYTEEASSDIVPVFFLGLKVGLGF